MRIDAKDSATLKGIAILAIVLHNYFHLLSPVQEDEFSFDPSRFHALLSAMGQPTEVIQALFSYFGHYGVQIFIFISAYGLAVQYWDMPQSTIAFVWQRIKKLYPMFLLAIYWWPLFLILMAGPQGAVDILRTHFRSLLLTFLGIENVLPHQGLPPVGPWWFLPFILQFYLLWPCLHRWIARKGVAGMVALSGGSLLLTYFLNDLLIARWSINLLQTPIGHLPEFCLGIAAARYGFVPKGKMVLAAAAVFALSNLDAHFWLLGFSSALVLMLAAYSRARRLVRQWPKLAVLGTLSMPMFLVNGFVRRPLVNLALLNHRWPIELEFGFAATAGAIWVAAYLFRLESLRASTRRFRLSRAIAGLASLVLHRSFGDFGDQSTDSLSDGRGSDWGGRVFAVGYKCASGRDHLLDAASPSSVNKHHPLHQMVESRAPGGFGDVSSGCGSPSGVL